MLQTVTYSSTATLKVRKLSNSSDFKLQSSRERKQIRPQSSLEKNYKCPFGPINVGLGQRLNHRPYISGQMLPSNKTALKCSVNSRISLICSITICLFQIIVQFREKISSSFQIMKK